MNKEYKYTIKDLPEDLRPRERLLKEGPHSLSTAELLAIVIRTGTTRETAIQLAERILAKTGGLRYLTDTGIEELCKIKGVGKAKIAQIKGAIELGKRLVSATPELRATIKSPQDVANLLMPQLRYLDKEHFKAILLNTKNQILDIVTISIGTLNTAMAAPRETFKEAIKRSAAAIILVHNHPSGDPTPSADDLTITKQINQAGKLLDIQVLDHVILGDGTYVSTKEKNIIP